MTGPNEPEQLDPDNPFAGMMAELHKGRDVLTRQVEPWRAAKVGDRVRMLDDWAPDVGSDGCRAGVYRVVEVSDTNLAYGSKVRCRIDPGWWAYNTHVVEIVGGNE